MSLRVKILVSFAGLLLVVIVRPLIAQQDQSESVCPLTPEQTQKSIAAFAKLMPLFKDPRCSNCHGGIDPFKDGGGHEGDTVETDTDCSTCHDDFHGHWQMAPEPMFFKGKSDEELCEQMKDFFAKAEGTNSFVGHMTNDNNGADHFIEAGLAGAKGMKLTAGESAEPPPGWSLAKVIQLSKEWVDTMGGRFHGDKTCGCKAQSYSLELDYEMKIDMSGFPLLNGVYDTKTEGGGSNLNALEIPLTMTGQGKLEGQAVMNLGGQGVIQTPVGTCVGQSQQSFQVHATAQFEEGDEESRGRSCALCATHGDEPVIRWA